MRGIGRRIAATIVLVSILGAVLTPPAARTGWVRTTVSISLGGVPRGYLVVRPADSGSASLPVLMELHGCCTTPDAELARSGFLDVTGPAILVYPAGQDRYWNAGACCGTTGADDVAFLTAVLKQVLAGQAGADPSRVFLAGYSNGGRMAYRMACERPGLFAAVAVFGAVNAKACADPAPVALLVAAGTADPELTISATGGRHTDDGYLEPTVEQQVEQYRRANGCRAGPTTSVAGTVTSTAWTACGSGDPVQLSLYAGADHAWPVAGGGTPGVAAVIWAFFQQASGR
jgi:poly(3-hydroxybutyrate) depolymerase